MQLCLSNKAIHRGTLKVGNDNYTLPKYMLPNQNLVGKINKRNAEYLPVIVESIAVF